MITHYLRTTEDKDLETIAESKNGVWTHVANPSDVEMESLTELYSLDDTIVEDIRDVFEVPRFEKVGNTVYFFTRYPYDVQDIDIDTVIIPMRYQ